MWKQSLWASVAVALSFATLGSVGCDTGGATIANGVVACQSDGECPSDYHCASDRTCWVNGQEPQSDAAVVTVDSGACPKDQLLCSGTCIDPVSNREHCGASGACNADAATGGAQCGAGQVCTVGKCSLSCAAGLVDCGGTCIDPQTSRAHCGASAACDADGGTGGAACGTGQVCAAGTCALSCPSGLVNCGGTCVDPQTSRAHCGASEGCGVEGGTPGTVCGTAKCAELVRARFRVPQVR
jgi:hypothetical protein